MRVLFSVIAAIWVSWGAAAAAVPAVPAVPGLSDPAFACRAAVAAAERAQAIPGRLLWAIALAESGRWDARRRARFAWPWTINAEGRGHFFPSKEAAIAAARALQARGVRSFDVGCMQVNLHHHPRAFADLEEAFDPVANAAYAGQFLRSLYALTGSWVGAAGRYHSATPERGEPYRERVVALWEGERGAPWPEPDAAAIAAAAEPWPAPPAPDRAARAAAGADAFSARAGRAAIAPIDHDRMARIILARRSQVRDAAAGGLGGRLVAVGDSIDRPRPMPRLAGGSALPASVLASAPADGLAGVPTSSVAGVPMGGARHFAQPHGRSFGSAAAGPVLRDARAESAFAERRADVLRQWRTQPPASVRPTVPTLLRGSSAALPVPPRLR